MGPLEVLGKLFIYNITTLKEIIPNLLLGLAVGLISCAILYRLSRVDKDYIKFNWKNSLLILLFLSAGVVVTSPLQAGKVEWMKIISILFCLICLSVCSYTDAKTGTVIVGYALMGFLIQVTLLVVHVAQDDFKIFAYDRKFLMWMFILFFVCFLLRGYTAIDLVLFYMNVICILIIVNKSHYIYGGVMIFVAFITVVIRDILFRIPKWVKGGKSGKVREFRAPFTLHILIGMLAALFLI